MHSRYCTSSLDGAARYFQRGSHIPLARTVFVALTGCEARASARQLVGSPRARTPSDRAGRLVYARFVVAMSLLSACPLTMRPCSTRPVLDSQWIRSALSPLSLRLGSVPMKSLAIAGLRPPHPPTPPHTHTTAPYPLPQEAALCSPAVCPCLREAAVTTGWMEPVASNPRGAGPLQALETLFLCHTASVWEAILYGGW